MNHTKIIELWDSPQDLAEEINVKYNTLMRWKYRNSIPSEYWTDIVRVAKEEDLPVTYRLLAETVAK
jgi:hypothetical protein